jgi:hypothetical protein
MRFGEVPAAAPASQVTARRRTIPFDYAFRYQLTGERDRVHRETVTVSIEATFVAVSIGYGVVPDVQPVRFSLPPIQQEAGVPIRELVLNRMVASVTGAAAPAAAQRVALDNVGALRLNAGALGPQLLNPLLPAPIAAIVPPAPRPGQPVPIADRATSGIRSLFVGELIDGLATSLDEQPGGRRAASTVGGVNRIGPMTAQVLRNGIRIRPDVLERVLMGDGTAPLTEDDAFEAVAAPPDQILFKYALFDDGSGREFQSEPLLNLSGLGISNGDRPFRHFARPIAFAPRSRIRLEITEISEFTGELHVSLQGYKMLGAPGSPTGGPTPRVRPSRRGGRR